MAYVDINAMYEAINRYLDDDEEDAQSYYEAPTIESVKQSLNAIGATTDRDKDKLDDVINILVASEEWGSETAYQTVVALEDGILTDDEIYTILSKDTLDNNIVLHVDTRRDEAEVEAEEAEEIIIDTTEEDEAESNWIDWIWGNTLLEPLEAILNAVSRGIGERLENFITNALGIEREE